ncbi:MAG: hypothetical protein FRX49_12393 [Trebouxia sp. A1-2]|nr:MAG: hypothetical protein FRX49_12393 [Trebouxia sp. A1-2]
MSAALTVSMMAAHSTKQRQQEAQGQPKGHRHLVSVCMAAGEAQTKDFELEVVVSCMAQTQSPQLEVTLTAPDYLKAARLWPLLSCAQLQDLPEGAAQQMEQVMQWALMLNPPADYQSLALRAGHWIGEKHSEGAAQRLEQVLVSQLGGC